jgi:hypothetical protein
LTKATQYIWYSAQELANVLQHRAKVQCPGAYAVHVIVLNVTLFYAAHELAEEKTAQPRVFSPVSLG